ncbi:hypothetical protein C8Q76DRAFT_465257 [Earliella scabrosa]|nr:hypothetical protein C8Q76DRAFT_465257 [Earliella scabrosa]
MRFSASAAALVAFVVSPVFAVCPGYNFALQDRGGQNYVIFDDACRGVATYILPGKNICTSGPFKCSPPPIRITDVLIDGLWYACRGDPNSGSCAGWKNTYCCRNDGGRLQEGEVAFEKNATTGFFTKVQKDE